MGYHTKVLSRMTWRPKKRYLDQSDQQLIQAYRLEADTGALAALYTRYLHTVLGICAHYLPNTEDCEDAAMEIYVILSLELKKATIQHIEGWLYQVVKNHCLKVINQRKKMTRILAMNPDTDDTVQMPTFYQEDMEEQQAQLEDVKKALNLLTPLQQKCVTLFYLEGYTYQEIAEKTGLPVSKVKSHIQNGKRNIKKALNNKFQHADQNRTTQ